MRHICRAARQGVTTTRHRLPVRAPTPVDSPPKGAPTAFEVDRVDRLISRSVDEGLPTTEALTA
jgi:hypothetical protein